MTRALALTTSTLRCGVALVDGEAAVAQRSIDDDRLHAERIFSMIDEVLAEASWSKSMLELVACDVGPGSFTGVRVGLSSAKGIAFGLGVPLVGVGSLEAMAYGARANAARSIVAILDARRDERFVAMLGADGHWTSPKHVPTANLAELVNDLGPDALWCGDDGGVLEPSRRISGAECDLPDATVLGRVAVARFRRDGADALRDLEPIYVRPADAKLPSLAPDRFLPRLL